MEGYASPSTGKASVSERTVIYCRISLDAAGEGLGVERQERECRELCDRNGWPVDDVLVDNDISATTGAVRPSFERLLADPPTRLVVWHTDRLVRKTTDLERVIETGVPVHAVTAGHIDLSTPSGRAVARTITAWATFEGEQKSLRQKASHRQRAEQGRPFWGSRRPFGYTLDAELHPVEGPALRECYRMYREGSTFAACAQYLDGLGLTTSQGKRWTGSRLARLMRDPRNAGTLVYGKNNPNGETVTARGNWPAIVPEDEFNVVMARAIVLPKGSQPEGEKVRSLLGGIGECAQCGDPFRQTWQHSKRASGEVVKTRIYQPACHHVSIRADWIDEQVEHALFVMAQRPVWNLVRGEQPEESAAMLAAAEAIKLRERIGELAQMYVDGDMDADSVKRATANARERLVKLEKEAQAFYGTSPLERAYGTASDTMRAWRSGDLSLAHKREAVRRMVASLTLRPRLNRNERANLSMIVLTEREAATSEAGPVFTDWPEESNRDEIVTA